MVNRAGRSKGCITCRRRRVKCDETKPFCAKCAQVGYQCEGYRPLNFIDERPQAIKKVESQSRRAGRSTDSLPPSADSPPDSRTHSASSCPTTVEFLPPRTLSSEETCKPSMPDGYNRDAVTDFTLKHLTGHLDEAAWRELDVNICQLYSPLLVAYKNEKGVSGLAFEALACSFYGRAHNQPDIIAAGNRQYVTALRALNATLGKSIPEPNEDILAAISILMLYEYLMRTSRTGWLQHQAGLAKLMAMWGPKAFRSPVSVRLFIENRGHIILGQCVSRQRCIFETDEWKSVPFELMPELRTPGQYLLDIFAHLPGLLQARDRAVSIPDDYVRREEAARIRAATFYRIELASQWYRDWRSMLPNDISIRAEDGAHELYVDDESNFVEVQEEELWFANVCVARPFVNYHSMRIMLYWLLLSLMPDNWTPTGEEDWPWADLSQPGNGQWASEVKRSVNAVLASAAWFRHPDHNMPFYLMGRLRTAFAAAQGPPKERLKALLEEIAGDVPGLPTAREASGMVVGLAKWMTDPDCGKRSARNSTEST